MDAGFCVEALNEALARYGGPEIFNTDQGSQFTNLVFTGALKEAGIRISMDGRGRCLDNIFIERLWRSLKYEAVYGRRLVTTFPEAPSSATIGPSLGSHPRNVGLDRVRNIWNIIARRAHDPGFRSC